ncbi:cytochrome c3 family protein [Geoglobus acetivorans]|uniref:Cytochrome c family protein n=1 Tax=Geoglobus acetivorans TaxID=565033 RepID=A0A0A7GDW4_GEOAI|nr:Cytochrome c family protein [Geoglobus acetivorans]
MERRAAMLLLFLIVAGIIVAAEGYNTFMFIEKDPRFCKTCHLMEEAWNKWNQSPHQGITCHECHEASIQDNMRLLVTYFTLQPEEVSDDVHVVIPNEKCENCHFQKSEKWPYVADTAGHKYHLENAKANCIDCHGGRVHKFVPDNSECKKCHSDISMKVPQMDFHCTNCHNFLADVKTNGENILPTSQDCKKCHKDRDIILALPEGAHSESECSNCHQPHITAEPFSCQTCHSLPNKPIHKYHADKDCKSCHVPHKNIDVRTVCETCHTDRKDHYPTLKCTTCHK